MAEPSPAVPTLPANGSGRQRQSSGLFSRLQLPGLSERRGSGQRNSTEMRRRSSVRSGIRNFTNTSTGRRRSLGAAFETISASFMFKAVDADSWATTVNELWNVEGYNMSKEQLDEMKRLFYRFDTDGSNEIDGHELRQLLQLLSFEPTDEEVQSIIATVDKDGNGRVGLAEFIHLMSAAQERRAVDEEVRSPPGRARRRARRLAPRRARTAHLHVGARRARALECPRARRRRRAHRAARPRAQIAALFCTMVGGDDASADDASWPHPPPPEARISVDTLRTFLCGLGDRLSVDEFAALLAEVPLDENGMISYAAFRALPYWQVRRERRAAWRARDRARVSERRGELRSAHRPRPSARPPADAGGRDGPWPDGRPDALAAGMSVRPQREAAHGRARAAVHGHSGAGPHAFLLYC